MLRYKDIDVFLGYFKSAKQTGPDQWMAHCPAHEDRKASLSIGLDDDHILLNCHAGCDTRDIIRAVGLEMQDLFLGESLTPRGPPKEKKPISEYLLLEKSQGYWDYKNEEGKTLFRTVRYSEGKLKRFVAFRPDGQGQWISNVINVRRVLYHLPELFAADSSKPVYIPEGEKHVDKLIELGFIATCNPFGAGKWRDEYAKHLKGRRVLILPDNDEPGKKHAQQIAKSLRGIATSVNILKLPELSEKGDIIDWLASGHDANELSLLAKEVMQATTILVKMDEGGRDNALFQYACQLRKKDIDLDEATELVAEAAANCQPPIPEGEAKRAVREAWRYPPAMASTMLQIASNRPVVTGSENGLHVEWGDKLITADITKLKTHTDGRITGILRVKSFMPGMPTNLHTASFNFLATMSRNRWATMLAERAPVINKTIWLTMLEELCQIVIDFIREGEPPVIINVAEEKPAPAEFLVEPILLKGDPVVIFGEMSSGKSYLAQTFAYVLALGPSADDIAGLRASKKHKVLYLDWEAEAKNISSRFCCLANGLGLPKEKFAYRRCSHRLADDADKVREIIANHEIDFVVIDSLGLAAGGELNSSQSAMEFFEALRTLKTSSLTIAHTAKNNNGHATIFGSSYFGNMARSVWEMRRYQEQGESEISVGLIHRKLNYGKLERPIGFRLVFDPLSTMVYREDIRNIPSVEAARSLSVRIKEILGRDGPSTSQQLAESLEASKETIERTLRRLRDRGAAQRIGTTWALLTEKEEELPPF